MVKVDDAKRVGLLYFSGGRLQIATEEAEKCGFATAIGADEADTHAAGDVEIQLREESAAGNFVADAFERHQIFGLATGGGEIDFRSGGAGAGIHVREIADQFVRFVDAGFGFSGACLGTATEPFQFVVDAIFERFLMLLLRVKIIFFGLEEFAVVPFHAEEAAFVGSAEFDHHGRDVLKKVAIMADNDAGERSVLQHGFEPLNSGEIKMVGRLVEQQKIRSLGKRGGDGEAFFPATRE